jgi:hypothetical protein
MACRGTVPTLLISVLYIATLYRKIGLCVINRELLRILQVASLHILRNISSGDS